MECLKKLKEEKRELDDRIQELSVFGATTIFSSVANKELLELRHHCMSAYSRVLGLLIERTKGEK